MDTAMNLNVESAKVQSVLVLKLPNGIREVGFTILVTQDWDGLTTAYTINNYIKTLESANALATKIKLKGSITLNNWSHVS